jgi:hypothetical protein
MRKKNKVSFAVFFRQKGKPQKTSETGLIKAFDKKTGFVRC